MRFLDRTQGRIPQPWRTLVDWFVTIAVAVAVVLAFQAEVAKPYRIPTPSMEPTLHCAKPVEYCEGRFSDRVIANRLAYRFRDPECGEIVVFKTPAAAERCRPGCEGSKFVKRIIGLPGEVVSEREGIVFINGDRLEEPYVAPSRRGNEDGRWSRVAQGHSGVLGDNRTHSWDSQTWGTVPRSSLIEFTSCSRTGHQAAVIPVSRSPASTQAELPQSTVSLADRISRTARSPVVAGARCLPG